jgi:dodecin
MSVARVTEISATSPESFEAAIRQGIDRANQTLRNVKGAWIKEQQGDVQREGRDHRVPGEHAGHIRARVARARPASQQGDGR